MSIRDVGTEHFGRYIPPHQTNADNFASGSSEDSQNFNQTTVFNGQKATGTGQPRNTGMQTSPGKPAPTGITGAMQTSPKKVSQTGGTQTTPPSSPKRSTSTGGTQTTTSMKQCTGPRSPGSTRLQSHQSGSNDPQYSFQCG